MKSRNSAHDSNEAKSVEATPDLSKHAPNKLNELCANSVLKAMETAVREQSKRESERLSELAEQFHDTATKSIQTAVQELSKRESERRNELTKQIHELLSTSATKSMQTAMQEHSKRESEQFNELLARLYLRTAQEVAAQVLSKHDSERIKELRASTTGIANELRQGFSSINLNPDISSIKNISSIKSSWDAINNDWKNIGNDLWRSWATVKDQHE